MSGTKCSKRHRNKTLNIRIQIQIDKIKFQSQQNPPTAPAESLLKEGMRVQPAKLYRPFGGCCGCKQITLI